MIGLLEITPGSSSWYREECHSTAEGWLFANPRTDKPYHQGQAQKTYLKDASTTAGIKGKVGWKTFRHGYRSSMDATGASLGVQKELMRHASISTTINVYGRATTESKRQTAAARA